MTHLRLAMEPEISNLISHDKCQASLETSVIGFFHVVLSKNKLKWKLVNANFWTSFFTNWSAYLWLVTAKYSFISPKFLVSLTGTKRKEGTKWLTRELFIGRTTLSLGHRCWFQLWLEFTIASLATGKVRQMNSFWEVEEWSLSQWLWACKLLSCRPSQSWASQLKFTCMEWCIWQLFLGISSLFLWLPTCSFQSSTGKSLPAHTRYVFASFSFVPCFQELWRVAPLRTF